MQLHNSRSIKKKSTSSNETLETCRKTRMADGTSAVSILGTSAAKPSPLPRQTRSCRAAITAAQCSMGSTVPPSTACSQEKRFPSHYADFLNAHGGIDDGTDGVSRMTCAFPKDPPLCLPHRCLAPGLPLGEPSNGWAKPLPPSAPSLLVLPPSQTMSNSLSSFPALPEMY